ncbi:ABC transporter permease [Sharpea azabuensis]|uniref:ABC transporter permease n=1 Tax=Sharpea azabuensis TaxID=322505 RepID=UPI0008E9A3FD|nr:ABC transporter permease [Sharpea azabuensis]HAJ16037.1 ABC transporter permease [Erysipelotrichaceae bacterium]SFE05347.1 putative ABC transport system permease protein [Sharpea azabuensis]SFK96796.1 putative ABC transport system permease protein [Sharpea azabuensis]HBZ51938.1 ABC transporter permease [Erysipelotrichaceae bacterium]HCG97524.1 ABC transporter permease [Erysipelotrichaceae bacterium]
MNLTVILGALELGAIFSILSLGLYISFKVLDIPDLTVDGSFTTGCAVSAIVTVASSPALGLLLAFVAGALAGLVTGLLITKLKINAILAGILTQTALYSINLRIMDGKPNISLLDSKTIFTNINQITSYGTLILLFIFVIVIVLLLNYFLRTQLGLALRACGDNEDMVRASSIDTDKMKLIGLSLANGLVGLSGALYTQQQTYSDITAGIGMMVIGLASIIIGTTFIKNEKVLVSLIATVVGAIFYRFVLTFALQVGITSGDLKLLSAVIVVIAISSTKLKLRGKKNARS